MDPNIQYSAEVGIYLLANGQRIEVASCLDNRCRLFHPRHIPPCSAELVIVIDGHERRRPIYLENGIYLDSNEVEFRFVAENEAEAA